MPRFVSSPTQKDVVLGPTHEQHRLEPLLPLSSIFILLQAVLRVVGGSLFFIVLVPLFCCFVVSGGYGSYLYRPLSFSAIVYSLNIGANIVRGRTVILRCGSALRDRFLCQHCGRTLSRFLSKWLQMHSTHSQLWMFDILYCYLLLLLCCVDFSENKQKRYEFSKIKKKLKKF